MSYFRVADDTCTLPHYVWADNKAHALRKVEALYGGIVRKNGAETTFPVEQVPSGAFVIDEPEDLREAREDDNAEA